MWVVRQYAKNTYKDNGYIIEGARGRGHMLISILH